MYWGVRGVVGTSAKVMSWCCELEMRLGGGYISQNPSTFAKKKMIKKIEEWGRMNEGLDWILVCFQVHIRRRWRMISVCAAWWKRCEKDETSATKFPRR